MPQKLLGWWHNSSLGDYFRTQIFKQHKGSRPSNFLFQIARGSGATLSECTFSSKKRTSPKDFLNADHFKTLRQKEPRTSHIRVLFDKTSTNNQNNFKTRSSSSLFQIARGSGATTRWMYFFFTKHSLLEDPKKRYKVSLQKALGWCLFLLNKTWRSKTRLLELNHEVLGGLSMRDPQDTPQGREKI